MSPDEQRALQTVGDLARAEIRGDVPLDEHDRGRDRALAAFARRGQLRWGETRLSRPAIGAWLAAAAIVCAIVAAVIAWPRAPLGFTVDGAIAAAGAYVHAKPGGAAVIVRFGDDSEIAFAPGSSGRIAEVGPRGARVQIESGAASVHVAHLPGARWSIEAGPFTIAVIGTRFDVAWSSESQALDVRLHEGAIAVRGPLAPSGIEVRPGQRLVARMREGEIRIDEGAQRAPEKASIEAPTLAPTLAPPAPPASAPPASATPTSDDAGDKSAARLADATARTAPRARSWPERVASGDFRGVLADAEARGIDRAIAHAPLADLVALADAARYAGRPDVARWALLAERDRFPNSAEASAAAFLLGRIADDAGRSPGEALRWYDAYLAEAPRGAFAAEALGRKMIALRRAGDPAARATATEYLRVYPKGPHAAAAREIAAP